MDVSRQGTAVKTERSKQMAEQIYQFEIPNLIVVCIDEGGQEEYGGRLYHCYQEGPVRFGNVMQMIKRMEELYNMLSYPQASTKDRCFIKKPETTGQEVTKVADRGKIMRQKGEMGTFVVRVQYRQNATWQGQVTWAEGRETRSFRSALELLKLIDNALDIEEGKEGEENSYEEQ